MMLIAAILLHYGVQDNNIIFYPDLFELRHINDFTSLQQCH